MSLLLSHPLAVAPLRSPAVSMGLEKLLKTRKIATQSSGVTCLQFPESTFQLSFLFLPSSWICSQFWVTELPSSFSSRFSSHLPCFRALHLTFSVLLAHFPFCHHASVAWHLSRPFQLRYLEDGNSFLSFLLPRSFTYSEFQVILPLLPYPNVCIFHWAQQLRNSHSQTQNSWEPQYTSSYHESQSSHRCSCPLKTPVYQTDLSPNLAVDLL